MIMNKSMFMFIGGIWVDAMIVALMVITYIPATSLWLPVQSK